MTNVRANASARRAVGFDCKTSPPPAIKEILRELGRGKGCVPRAAIRDLAKRVNGYYDKSDKIEALIKFLTDTVVAVEDPNERRLYLVRPRVKHIIDCCERRQDPAPSEYSPMALLDVLRGANAAACGVKESSPLKVPLGQVARVSADKRKTAGNGADAQETTDVPKYVMYLDPFEEDVWRNLLANAKLVDGQKRIAVTRNYEARHREWSSGALCCTAEEYQEAFVKFVKADIIGPVGTSGNGHDTYRFIKDPSAFVIIQLSSRDDHGVSAKDLELIRKVEQGDFVFPETGSLNKAFEEWIGRRFPGYNVNTAKTKIIGYRPTYREHSWGIIAYQEKGGPPLRCVEGFERFHFMDKAVMMEKTLSVASQAEQQTANAVEEPSVAQVEAVQVAEAATKAPALDMGIRAMDRIDLLFTADADILASLDDASLERQKTALSKLRTMLPVMEELLAKEEVRRETERQRLAELEQKKATLVDELRQHEEAARRMREEIENIDVALGKPTK